MSELSVGSTAVRPWSVPTAGRAVVAVVRRDSAERRFLGIPFVLDFLFGVVNLVVFSFISRVLRQPAHAQLGHAGSYFDFVAVGITFLRSAAYLGVASALLGLDVGAADWLGVAVVLLLGGAATMCLGMALAAVTVAFDSGITVGRLLIVAVAFLSGTYFPVATLPPVLRWLSVLLPTRIALDGLRAALSGNGWAGSALLLAAAVAVGVPLGVWLFGQALRLAVSRGTLTRG